MVFLAKERAGRQRSTTPEPTPTRRRHCCHSTNSVVDFREAAAGAAHYLLASCGATDCVRYGSTAKHSRCEHPQWSSRSPVWLTGDRRLCCAPHGEVRGRSYRRTTLGRPAGRARGPGAPYITSAKSPPSVSRSRTFKGARRMGSVKRTDRRAGFDRGPPWGGPRLTGPGRTNRLPERPACCRSYRRPAPLP